MKPESQNLYQILHVHADCSFEQLKDAFRKQAKLCHPDLFGDSPEKTEEFQRLIHAFDILSDPDSRGEYDRMCSECSLQVPSSALRTESIMDSVADDILEEMVVGNDAPRHTTLMTLMLDLEKTEKFIMFRQAKNHFYAGDYARCEKICDHLVTVSPCNILYHYYLGEAARMRSRHSKAIRHLGICLRLGLGRTPPQRLSKIRRHYRNAQRHSGFIGKIISWLMGDEAKTELSEQDKMRMILEETFNKGMHTGGRSSRVRHRRRQTRLLK